MVVLQFYLRNYKHLHNGFSRARLISVESSSPHLLAKANCNQSLLGYMYQNNYASVLRSCTNVKDLRRAHAQIVIRGLEFNIFLQTKVFSVYACLYYLGDARKLFDKMSEPDVHAWNTMIRGYVTKGLPEETLGLYCRSKQAGIQPSSMTFNFALKACAGIFALEEGKGIHCHVFKSGFESDVFVASALINAYTKCGILGNARQVFDEMSQRNVVSWTTMIGGYACYGDAHEALSLFHRMKEEDVKPNPITLASVLPAYAELKDLEQGKWIHDYAVRSDFESNVLVGTELIKMYLKIGSIENARHAFDRISHGNEVSWSAMITGYFQKGYPSEALGLFYQMQLESIAPEPLTLVSFLSACGQLEASQQALILHSVVSTKCLNGTWSHGMH